MMVHFEILSRLVVYIQHVSVWYVDLGCANKFVSSKPSTNHDDKIITFSIGAVYVFFIGEIKP